MGNDLTYRTSRSEDEGLPIAFTGAFSTAYLTQDGAVNVKDYRVHVFELTVTDKDTATRIDAGLEWSIDGGTTWAAQPTEAFDAGTVTLADAEWQYDISGKTAPFSLQMPVMLDKRGTHVRISLKSDLGVPVMTAKVWRGN